MAFLLIAVIALTLSGAASASAISRATALARAQAWVDNPVPYSQTRYYAGYRTDCSGFASMTWQAPMSYSTRSMHLVAHRIPFADLKPGDALLAYNYHIRIFYGWVDATHTKYVAYEQTGPTTKSSIKSISSDFAVGYRAYRYNRIVNSPQSRNVILNPTFDVWASDWWRGENPVWWSMSGYYREAVAIHRKDIRRTSKSSLALVNPSNDPLNVAELSQTAPVTANVKYTLSIWARTDGDPASLRLSLRCQDASGIVLAEESTTGDAWGLDSSAFKSMKLALVTPPGTTKATVVVGLAGQATVAMDSVGVSAILDDVSLTPPPLPLATLTQPHAPLSVRHGVAFTSYGYLRPRHTAGSSAVTLQCYRYQSGHWVLRKTVKAKVLNYSSKSRYSVRLSLPSSGKWRIRAYHADSRHRASYSTYRYIRVR